jgi:hypothetical protein
MWKIYYRQKVAQKVNLDTRIATPTAALHIRPATLGYLATKLCTIHTVSAASDIFEVT